MEPSSSLAFSVPVGGIELDLAQDAAAQEIDLEAWERDVELAIEADMAPPSHVGRPGTSSDDPAGEADVAPPSHVDRPGTSSDDPAIEAGVAPPSHAAAQPGASSVQRVEGGRRTAHNPFLERFSGKRKRVEEAKTLAEIERASGEALQEIQALRDEQKRILKDLTARNARIWAEDFKKEGAHPLQIHGGPPPQALLSKYGAFLRRYLIGEADMQLLRRKLFAWREAQRQDGVEVSEVLRALKEMSEHLDILGDDFRNFEEALSAVLDFLDRKLRPSRTAPRSRVLAHISLDEE